MSNTVNYSSSSSSVPSTQNMDFLNDPNMSIYDRLKYLGFMLADIANAAANSLGNEAAGNADDSSYLIECNDAYSNLAQAIPAYIEYTTTVEIVPNTDPKTYQDVTTTCECTDLYTLIQYSHSDDCTDETLKTQVAKFEALLGKETDPAGNAYMDQINTLGWPAFTGDTTTDKTFVQASNLFASAVQSMQNHMNQALQHVGAGVTLEGFPIETSSSDPYAGTYTQNGSTVNYSEPDGSERSVVRITASTIGGDMDDVDTGISAGNTLETQTLSTMQSQTEQYSSWMDFVKSIYEQQKSTDQNLAS